MTQEREAMERLVPEEYIHAPSGMGPLAYQWEDKPHRLVYELANEVQKLYAKEDARHARARQPITVEGLVAMGAELVELMSYQTKYLLKGIRIFVSVHGDMEWYYAEPYQSHLLQVCPAPENMLHVDELVERVGS